MKSSTDTLTEAMKVYGRLQRWLALMLSSPTDAANRMLMRRCIAERW